jgi:hypothetical protein
MSILLHHDVLTLYSLLARCSLLIPIICLVVSLFFLPGYYFINIVTWRCVRFDAPVATRTKLVVMYECYIAIIYDPALLNMMETDHLNIPLPAYALIL